MENQTDALSNRDLRQLWTRFEGLVGHQLYRLRVDGCPLPTCPASPSKAVSSGILPAADSSSLCSLLTSEMSSLTTATSPARLPEQHGFVRQGSSVDGDDVGFESGVDASEGKRCVGVVMETVHNSWVGGGLGDSKVCGSENALDSDEGGVDGGGGYRPRADGYSEAGDAVDPNEGDADGGGRENAHCQDVGSGRGDICTEAGDAVDPDIGDVDGGVVDGRGGGGCGSGSDDNAEEIDRGGGDGVAAETSVSCCVLPSESRSTSQVSVGNVGMKRNASSNALNTSECQQLFGLPYVASATAPLLNLLMVTVEELSGAGLPPAYTLLKLRERRRECKNNMIGVYKQSLLLESQLHQYLNPGLVTSLNRRVARATFEAEMMVNLIDKLRKESKKSVDDPERKRKVVNVSVRLKSLLGRQKCEWQCVGRLKETLTMAREMKDLLCFIARLSNTLERSKTAFGSLQERPPPYDYCSPYGDLLANRNDKTCQLQKRRIAPTLSEPACVPAAAQPSGSSDNQSSSDHVALDNLTAPPDVTVPDPEVKVGTFPQRDSELSSEAYDIGAVSDNTASLGYMGRGRGIKGCVTARGRSLSPRKLGSSPGLERSRSTNFELDSYSSLRDSHVLSKSSTREALSANSNESKAVVFDLSDTHLRKDRIGRSNFLAGSKTRDSDFERERNWRGRTGGSKRSRQPSYEDVHIKKGALQQLAQECARDIIRCKDKRGENDPCRKFCQGVMGGSPPRACPRDYSGGVCEGDDKPCVTYESKCRRVDSSGTYECGSGKTCVIRKCVPRDAGGIGSRKNSARWNRSTLSPRSRASDVEGSRFVAYPSADSSDSSLRLKKASSRKRAQKQKKTKSSTGSKSPGKSAKSSGAGSKASTKSRADSSAKGKSSPSSGRQRSPSPKGRGSAKGRGSKGKGSGSADCSRDSMEESPLGSDDFSCAGSGRPNDIFIDIESEHPNQKTAASCPPACCNRRRIRVTVNRRSSSTATAKKGLSGSRSMSPKSRSGSQKSSTREALHYEEAAAAGERTTSDESSACAENEGGQDEALTREPVPGASDTEEEGSEQAGGLDSADDAADSVEDGVADAVADGKPGRGSSYGEAKTMSVEGSGETTLQAVPSAYPSPKPSASVKKSDQRGDSSAYPSPKPSASVKQSDQRGDSSAYPSPKPSGSVKQSDQRGDASPIHESSASPFRQEIAGSAQASSSGEEYFTSSTSQSDHWMTRIRNLDFPGSKDPWKWLAAALLLFFLGNALMSFLWSCCGCGSIPNPFFFLTNSLASRVTVRHNGLPPI